MMKTHSFKRSGQIMLGLAWVVLAGGLVCFFYWHTQITSPLRFKSAHKLVVEAARDGHYYIQGSLNQRSVSFLVDTGASYVAIPQNIATELKLQGRYPISLSTANGETTASLTRIDDLSFGDFHLKDVKVVIIPQKAKYVLLGMNVLGQFNLSQQNKQLTTYSK